MAYLLTGYINVTITPVDVSRQAYLAAFPGEFSGVLDRETDDSPFYSLGVTEFEFSQDGEPVYLRDDLGEYYRPTIQIPIYFNNYQDGTPIKITDPPIPLWSLNEDTGIWEQEGTGKVTDGNSPTGLVLEAKVSHFSWWNCDVSLIRAQAYVTVYGLEPGTALIKARTDINLGWRPTTVETVSRVGVTTPPLYIPAGVEVCFWAEINFDNGSSGTTPEVCINAGSDDRVPVPLGSPIEGSVSIIATPETAADDRLIDYVGFAYNRVQLLPLTIETAVSYTIIDGALPPGLLLYAVSATRAEIAGVPTEEGKFYVTIQATDSDGDTDNVTIFYEILPEDQGT